MEIMIFLGILTGNLLGGCIGVVVGSLVLILLLKLGGNWLIKLGDKIFDWIES